MRKFVLLPLLVTLCLCCTLPAFAATSFSVPFQNADGTLFSTTTAQTGHPLLAPMSTPTQPDTQSDAVLFYGWIYSTDGGVTFSEEIWDFTTTLTAAHEGLILRASFVKPFSGGDGTFLSPYLIATAEDLQLLSSLYQSGNALTRFAAYYKLTADITLNASLLTDGAPRADATPFVPIGTEACPFAGTFDGDGYTISGLYIPNDTTSDVGLFRALDGSRAQVANLTLADSYVSGKDHVGLLAGTIFGSVSPLENLSVFGVVRGANMVGGITGLLTGTALRNCVADVSVFGTEEVGGIVGRLDSSSILDACTVRGTVTATNYAGGIAGVSTGGLLLSDKGANAATVDVQATRYAGGAFGAVLAEPTLGLPLVQAFTLDGTVTADAFASPFIGITLFQSVTIADCNVADTAVIRGDVEPYYLRVSDAGIQLYAVAVSPEHIAYTRASLLSFALLVQDGDTVYRFATDDLCAVADAASIRLTAKNLAASPTYQNGILEVPLSFVTKSGVTTLVLSAKAFGEERSVSYRASLAADVSASLYFGISYTFVGNKGAVVPARHDALHATTLYAETATELLGASFFALHTGIGGALSHCMQNTVEATTGISLANATSDIGLYGYTPLSQNSTAELLFSYRTKIAGTPLLLPVLQSVALDAQSHTQAMFGGGVLVFANGANTLTLSALTTTISGTTLRLAPLFVTDTVLFCPLTALLPADLAVQVGKVSVAVTSDTGEARATIPASVRAADGDIITSFTPQLVNGGITIPDVTKAYGVAPNGTPLTFHAPGVTTDIEASGAYWLLVPCEGSYAIVSQSLFRVTFETPYVTKPTQQLFAEGTAATVLCPTIHNPTAYTFLGWYTAEDVRFDFNTERPTDNLTLYAKWAMDGVTITEQPKAVTKVFDPLGFASLSTAYKHIYEQTLTFSIQWYYCATPDGTFLPLDGATDDTLHRQRVPHSGYYYAVITASDGIACTTDTKTETVALTITPLTVGRPVLTAPQGFAYTGYPLAVTFTYPYAYRTSAGGVFTNRGDYTAEVVLANEEDYRFADGITAPVLIDWSIVARVVPLPEVLGNYVYDGTVQHPVTTIHPDYTVSPVSGSLALTYPVTFTLVDSANCVWADGTNAPVRRDFIIAPRTPTMTLFDTTKAYDGKPIAIGVATDSTAPVTFTFYHGETLLDTPPTIPGTYRVVATVAAVANKTAAGAVSATVTITDAIYTVLWSNTVVNYTGTPQLPTATVLANGAPISLAHRLVASADTILPDTYTITLVPDALPAHTRLASETVTFTILPTQIALPLDFPSALTMTAGGALPNALTALPDGLTLHIAPMPTTPGTYTVLLSFSAAKGYVAPASRPLKLTLLAGTHTAIADAVWFVREDGFDGDALPTLRTESVDILDSLSLPRADTHKVYTITGTPATTKLTFAGTKHIQVWKHTDGELVRCEGIYDAAQGTMTVDATDGTYLVTDETPCSELLLVVLVGGGSTALIYGAILLTKACKKKKSSAMKKGA